MISSRLIGTGMQGALLGGFLAVASAALAQTPTDAQLKKGQEVYQYWCWNCHGSGAGKPGTEALRAKYKDARPADLEQRTDLAPAVIKTFVRKGVSIMPIFRKTEITDTDLDALAIYLARNTKAK
jgi:(+)-pinoresinol hydroxylase